MDGNHGTRWVFLHFIFLLSHFLDFPTFLLKKMAYLFLIAPAMSFDLETEDEPMSIVSDSEGKFFNIIRE